MFFAPFHISFALVKSAPISPPAPAAAALSPPPPNPPNSFNNSGRFFVNKSVNSFIASEFTASLPTNPEIEFMAEVILLSTLDITPKALSMEVLRFSVISAFL